MKRKHEKHSEVEVDRQEINLISLSLLEMDYRWDSESDWEMLMICGSDLSVALH
jgi:hypothetical protein